MIRRDLLALDDDDLATISNRGNVNRAHRELEKGDLKYELARDAENNLSFSWSDGVLCTIFGEHTVAKARCSCPATRICRHIVRSVLAYQRDTSEEASKPLEPWDPGTLVEWSESFYSSHRRGKAGELEEAGLVVELQRGLKPTAKFHGLGHALKFMVPHDGRYVQCDCTEDSPCIHALLAIRAFSRTDADETVTLIETGERHPTDTGPLDEAEAAIARILADGISRAPEEVMARLEGHEKRLKAVGLVWPAEILSDLRQQHAYYHSHDARFSSERLGALIGEFILRADAIRSDERHEIPLLFVGGRPGLSDHTRLGGARLVGLGCTVATYRNSTRIEAVMVDDKSGRIIVAAHHFAHDGERPSFAGLARRLVFRGRNLHDVGSGQLVIKSGRLTSAHELSIGRAAASRYAQKFAWDQLPAPVFMESFSAVFERLKKLPPASLRPRAAAEDLHVCPISSVEGARFDARSQTVAATLLDANGGRATLRHEYLHANHQGSERLLAALGSNDRMVWIAGRVRMHAEGLRWAPCGCVFEGSDGSRYLVQPHVDTVDGDEVVSRRSASTVVAEDSLTNTRVRIAREVGDVCLLGVARLQNRDRERLAELGSEASKIGLARIGSVLVALSNTPNADDTLQAAMLTRLYHELG